MIELSNGGRFNLATWKTTGNKKFYMSVKILGGWLRMYLSFSEDYFIIYYLRSNTRALAKGKKIFIEYKNSQLTGMLAKWLMKKGKNEDTFDNDLTGG